MGVDAAQHGPHVLDVGAHRALGRAPLVAADRPDDRLMLGDDQITSIAGPTCSISEGWSTSRIQRVKVTSRSLPAVTAIVS